MIRVLHLADVHLGASFSGFGELAESRREALLDEFRRLPEIVGEQDIHAVLIAGDLFDSARPPDGCLIAARETLRRVGDLQIPVFIVPGNHDPVTLHPNPYGKPLGQARVFTAPAFDEPVTVSTPGGPLNVYGVAYDPARERDPLRAFRREQEPGVHVALLHLSVRGNPLWAPSPNTLSAESEELERLQVDYIALGDHHGFRPPEQFPAEIPACYSGSMAALDLTEKGDHGYVIAELKPGEPPSVQLMESSLRKVEDLGQIDVSDLESDREVAETVAEKVPDGVIPIVELTGTPTYPLDAEKVGLHLRERFYHAAVNDSSWYCHSERLSELSTQDTIVGHVAQLGLERIGEAEDEGERRVAERALRHALSVLGAR